MNKISNIEIIQQFTNGENTYGIYWVDFDGSKKLFVRNNNSVSVVMFLLGQPPNKCLLTVRDDVIKELLEIVDKQKDSLVK